MYHLHFSGYQLDYVFDWTILKYQQVQQNKMKTHSSVSSSSPLFSYLRRRFNYVKNVIRPFFSFSFPCISCSWLQGMASRSLASSYSFESYI